MGCVNPKPLTSKDYVLEIQTDRDRNVDEKLSPFLSLTHPSNVNWKYKFIVQIDWNQKTGKGIFETSAYIFLGNKEQLDKLREEFWIECNTGNPNVWVHFRDAVETKNEGNLNRKLFQWFIPRKSKAN